MCGAPIGAGGWVARGRATNISPVQMRRGGDVLRLGVNGARAGGLKCAAQEVDFGNRIGYSGTVYEITGLGLAGLPEHFRAAVFCRRFASRELF